MTRLPHADVRQQLSQRYGYWSTVHENTFILNITVIPQYLLLLLLLLLCASITVVLLLVFALVLVFLVLVFVLEFFIDCLALYLNMSAFKTPKLKNIFSESVYRYLYI